MHMLTRKAVVAATTLVLGVGGSALITGTTYAGAKHDDCGCNSSSSHEHSAPVHHVTWSNDGTRGTGGNGGSGGNSNANCAVPIGASVGLLGQGGDNKQCNATAGAGGNGGSGIN
ncbi:MAG TPA: hypothetical protein VFE65_29460 [Pseudonocardia sp.]|jgi:hypothetical protein|nr:hypothetical protein [Pseudonocardia sp.]